MNTKYINRFLKFEILLLTIVVLLGCSKESIKPESEELQEIPIKTGSIKGTLQLFDRYGKESYNYSDIKIKILKDNTILGNYSMYKDSTYIIEDIEIGELLMVLEKPRYGSYDTLKIKNNETIDIISKVRLLEFPKADLTILNMKFENGYLGRTTHTYFADDNWQLVRNEFFFSKDSSVNFLNYDLRYLSASSYGGDNNSSSPLEEGYTTDRIFLWSRFDFKLFEEVGFKQGDTIYVKAYPTNYFFSNISYWNQNANFEVKRHIRKNGSNTYNFVL